MQPAVCHTRGTSAHFVKAEAAATAFFLKDKKGVSPILLIETSRFPRALQVRHEGGDYQLACHSLLVPILQHCPVTELGHDEALYIPDLDC
jgi:hypothetical protein